MFCNHNNPERQKPPTHTEDGQREPETFKSLCQSYTSGSLHGDPGWSDSRDPLTTTLGGAIVATVVSLDAKEWLTQPAICCQIQWLFFQFPPRDAVPWSLCPAQEDL